MQVYGSFINASVAVTQQLKEVTLSEAVFNKMLLVPLPAEVKINHLWFDFKQRFVCLCNAFYSKRKTMKLGYESQIISIYFLQLKSLVSKQ